VGEERPFFLFLHYWDPHAEYNPPEEYAQMFDPDYRGTITGDMQSIIKRLVPGVNPRDRQHVISLYDGEIRYTDDHLAKLFAYLAESGLAENTLVVLTSDHGEEFLEHDSTGHTRTCYEELIRVPLIIRAPWIQPQAPAFDVPVENVDIFPTILGLLGLPALTHPVQGHDLTALILRGEAPARRYFFCETQMARRHGRKATRGVWRSTRDRAGLKVHHFAGGGQDHVDLYDLTQDPGEAANLRDSRAEVREEMAAQLARLHAEHTELAGTLKIKHVRIKKTKRNKRATEELEEQLKGLGYVQ
ncbi:MAG: sulfatase family protein, partial [Alphaproteobacteria bacterium]